MPPAKSNLICYLVHCNIYMLTPILYLLGEEGGQLPVHKASTTGCSL